MLLGVVGPSGSGKGYLRRAIIAALGVPVSDVLAVTTREPRPGDGGDIVAGIRRRAFVAQVSAGRVVLEFQPYQEHWYGYWAASLMSARESGAVWLTEVHASQVDRWREYAPNSHLLGILCTTELLRRRMVDRGDSPVEVSRRVGAAKAEMARIRSFARSGLIETLLSFGTGDESLEVGRGVRWAEDLAHIVRSN